jgi:hypothetical protein
MNWKDHVTEAMKDLIARGDGAYVGFASVEKVMAPDSLYFKAVTVGEVHIFVSGRLDEKTLRQAQGELDAVAARFRLSGEPEDETKA